jgi:hypothetical protein
MDLPLQKPWGLFEEAVREENSRDNYELNLNDKMRIRSLRKFDGERRVRTV